MSNTQDATLAKVLECLKRENERPGGPICDTIWYSPHETLFDFIESALAAPGAEAAAPDAEATKEALADLIRGQMTGVYHCTRVWEAWNVGTMDQDDFESYAESDSPDDLADAILAHLAAPAAQHEAPKLRGRAEIVECWNDLPEYIRQHEQMKPLYETIQRCEDVRPEAPAVPAGFLIADIRAMVEGADAIDKLVLEDYWDETNSKPVADRLRSMANRLAAAPAAPAAQVPPMLTPEQIERIADDGHRTVSGGIYSTSVCRFAEDIIAERDKQWIAALGVHA